MTSSPDPGYRPSYVLHSIPLFSNLEPAELEAVLAVAESFHVNAGHRLCEQGKPGDCMYVIEVGKANVRAKNERGKVVPIANLGPGDIVGELALIDSRPRSADVIAATTLRGYRIDRRRFRQLRAKEHPAAYKITKQIAVTVCGRLRRVNENVASMVGGVPMPTNPERPSKPPEEEVKRSFWKNLLGKFGGG